MSESLSNEDGKHAAGTCPLLCVFCFFCCLCRYSWLIACPAQKEAKADDVQVVVALASAAESELIPTTVTAKTGVSIHRPCQSLIRARFLTDIHVFFAGCSVYTLMLILASPLLLLVYVFSAVSFTLAFLVGLLQLPFKYCCGRIWLADFVRDLCGLPMTPGTALAPRPHSMLE